MSYASAIDQLNAMTPELFTRPGQPRRKFSLDEIGVLLAALGNPHHRVRSVLIAGTNGKGSTAATLAAILSAAGLRAGLYTSPHLERVNERIRIGVDEIADGDFARLFFRVQETAERLLAEGKLPQLPSFFEVLTAQALLYFAEAGVELAVLEVGMGGRLDATNIVDPLLSVVTDISLDHTEWLGSTIAEIAREKAGILRTGGTLIALPQEAEVNDVLGEAAARFGARKVDATIYLPQIDSNTTTHCQPVVKVQNAEKHPSGAKAHRSLSTIFGTTEVMPFQNPTSTTSCYTTQALGAEIEIASPLTGAHQQRNIALAIAAAVELATAHGFAITPEAIAAGIRQTRWPGRLERIQAAGVEWILDVAHNPAGALALRSGLSGALSERRPLRLIFSCLRDKPINELAQILFPLFDEVIFAPIHSARATAMEDLQAAACATKSTARSAESVGEALRMAAENAGGGVVVVSGSVYLVGEARSLLLAMPEACA